MNELDAIIVTVGEGFDLENNDAQFLLNLISELGQERDEAVRQRELPFHDHNLWQKEKRYRELAESELATAHEEIAEMVERCFDLREQLEASQKQAAQHADAAEALAGLEKLRRYGREDQCWKLVPPSNPYGEWSVEYTDENTADGEAFIYYGSTPLAAVRQAEEARK